MKLNIQHLSMDDVAPNAWNPNKQTERQFAAEIESIQDHGFIMPIIVRQVDNAYQIIDGEHRYRALTAMKAQGQSGAGNVNDLLQAGHVPAIVLDADENTAKRLTIILNETRGRADLALLAEVVADLSQEIDVVDLLSGMPYTEKEVEELISVTEFDWDALSVDPNNDTSQSEADHGKHIVTAELDDEVAEQWRKHLANLTDILPQDRKMAAGIAIGYLLDRKANDSN